MILELEYQTNILIRIQIVSTRWYFRKVGLAGLYTRWNILAGMEKKILAKKLVRRLLSFLVKRG